MRRFILFMTAAAVLDACEVYNPEEEIPSYIHIDSISLSTNYPVQGSNAHKITDAWVYIDNTLIGAFELPVTFPVLHEGPHQVAVGAGIKMNGIAATRIEYPFYRQYTEKITLEKAKIVTLKPAVTYVPSPPADFIWKEDFEGPATTLTKIPDSDTALNILQNSPDVFEGKKCGVVTLDSLRPFFEGVSPDFNWTKGGNPVFLELHYKTNNLFVVGIYSATSQMASLYIKPSAQWNKLYINLSGELNQVSNSKFKVFIGMVKDKDVKKPQLFLDNIKLIH